MEKRTSVSARILALLALIAAIVVVVALIAGASGDGDASKHGRGDQHHAKEAKKKRSTAATYTVKSGDTLTAIAHKTGVSVAEILALNPETDPQILLEGETLKLR